MGNDATTLGVAYTNATNDAAYVWNGASDRYAVIHEGQLYHQYNIWGKVDSTDVSLANPDSGAATLILFRDMGQAYGLRDEFCFRGKFCQLTNTAPGTIFHMDLAQLGFDHVAESMMLVHTQRAFEIRRSFRDTFLKVWNDTFTAQKPAEVDQNGDPEFGWDPFPIWDTAGYLNSNQVYLTIDQRLTVDVPNWPSDYDVEIKYWLHVYRADDGSLKGYVRRGWVGVESGFLTKVVMAIVEPNAKLIAYAINDQLQARLDAIGKVKNIYFLPGAQPMPIQKGEWNVFMWNSVNDVTIIVEP